jgi:hypothetical protein
LRKTAALLLSDKPNDILVNYFDQQKLPGENISFILRTHNFLKLRNKCLLEVLESDFSPSVGACLPLRASA